MPIGRCGVCRRLDEDEIFMRTSSSEDLLPCRDKVLLLNKTTEVINFWQDEEKKHSLEEAAAQFPDCKFQGA